VALQLFLKAPDQPRWGGSILFDDDVRGALRASSPGGRALAGTLSNGAYALALFPLVVDAGFVTWLGRDRRDTATQLALIDLEALTAAALVTTVTQRTVGRARPFLQTCQSRSPDGSCSGTSNARNTSFISGHATLAFAGATTLCVQHSRLSLYGDGDAAVCPAALGVAAAVSTLRIVADRHWVSDVIGGALAGSAVGYAVSALHLRGGAERDSGVDFGGEKQSVTFWMRF
jgi:membrane-associated phospholipid phosphatase